MTDTKDVQKAATEGTWSLPLLLLAPVAALRIFTDLSAPWFAISWGLVALAVILMAAGWVTVYRNGTRGRAAWGACLLVHAVLVWQLIALVRE
ncbi:hypothetical protein [Streptomyces sp. NPDC059957]|uniref:hypothetical protein n=1 Tax=unclassified Streptomyces TaxID=2593676 RepID=UPI003648C75E